MKRNKKTPSWVTILVVAFVILAALSDEMPEDVFFTILGVIVLLTPVVLVIALVRMIARKLSAASETHTHDRIDHSSDLKINPKTGRAESVPVRAAVPHSAKEHWQQQLDALLANGTIDKTEYRALMNRKF